MTDESLTTLVRARVIADDGSRTDLDDVIAEFGFDRAELEAELARERHA